MDSFEINKYIGWALFALLIIFGGRTFMDLYNGGHGGDQVQKAAYFIEAEDDGADKANKKAEKKEVDIKPLLASASVDSGAKQAKKCLRCHSFEKGGAHKMGPALYDIVNRKIGGASGYTYSKSMAAKGGDWDYDALAAFLKAPKKYMPKTAMSFSGIRDANKLADLIAFMRSKSDSPAQLP